MSILTTTAVSCDICHWWEVESQDRKAALSRKRARAQGWRTYNHQGERFDVCPTCQEKGFDPWNRPRACG